jgi:transposase
MQIKRDLAAWEQRRFQALELHRGGMKQADIARQLHVSRQAVSQWIHSAKRSGKRALTRKPHEGRPPKLSSAQQKQLPRLLARGPRELGYSTELWTAQRIARLILEHFEVRLHVRHVPKLLKKLGWSFQRPTGRAAERDEAAVARWVTKEWPRIKKKPRQPRRRSSLPTNPDSA